MIYIKPLPTFAVHLLLSLIIHTRSLEAEPMGATHKLLKWLTRGNGSNLSASTFTELQHNNFVHFLIREVPLNGNAATRTFFLCYSQSPDINPKNCFEYRVDRFLTPTTYGGISYDRASSLPKERNYL